MNTLLESLKFFVYNFLELTALFLGVSAIIGVAFRFISQDALGKALSGSVYFCQSQPWLSFPFPINGFPLCQRLNLLAHWPPSSYPLSLRTGRPSAYQSIMPPESFARFL